MEYLLTQVWGRLEAARRRFVHEEKGASDMVVVIVLIVVVVAVAAIFRDRITDAASAVADRLDNFINTTK